MRSKFDEQLKTLNEEMMHMGSMIEESIQKQSSIYTSGCR